MSASSTSAGSRPSLAASISPRFSRSSGGIHGRPTASKTSRFGPTADLRAPAEDAVLVDFQVALHAEQTNGDVVRLRSGEVVKRGAIRRRGHDPQVEPAGPTAGPPSTSSSPRASSCLTSAYPRNVSATADGWSEATRISTSPTVSDRRRKLPATSSSSTPGTFRSRSTSGRTYASASASRYADRVRLVLFDAAQDGLLERLTHARQPGEPTGARRFFELAERLHVEASCK